MINMDLLKYPFYLRLICALSLFVSIHSPAKITVGNEALLRLSYFHDLSGVNSCGTLFYKLSKSDSLVKTSDADVVLENMKQSWNQRHHYGRGIDKSFKTMISNILRGIS